MVRMVPFLMMISQNSMALPGVAARLRVVSMLLKATNKLFKQWLIW
jgi:hypothetical protein